MTDKKWRDKVDGALRKLVDKGRLVREKDAGGRFVYGASKALVDASIAAAAAGEATSWPPPTRPPWRPLGRAEGARVLAAERGDGKARPAEPAVLLSL